MDEARAEEEAGSVTMREQWLFSNENVPVNCESSFFSICVQDSWWKREYSTHALFPDGFSWSLLCCSKYVVQADVFSALAQRSPAVLAQSSNFSNRFLKCVSVSMSEWVE